MNGCAKRYRGYLTHHAPRKTKEKMTAKALKHLAKVDPVMRKLIRQVGECELSPETRRSPFQ